MKQQSDGLAASVVAFVDRDRMHATNLLKELVRTRSYSHHEGRANDRNSVTGRIYNELLEHGTQIHVQNVGPQSDNLIQVLPGKTRTTFVIDAHTDAVPEGDAGSWHGDNPYSGADGWVEYLGGRRIRLEIGDAYYEANIRDRMARVWETKRSDRRRRIIYGRGSYDNKGCVVSLLLAMRALSAALVHTGDKLAGTVIASYSTDEETSDTGIHRFACDRDSWLRSNGYLDGESDSAGMLKDVTGVALDGSYGWVPIVGHRGAVQLLIRTNGRAAHAATPELGLNAVEEMANLLNKLGGGRSRLTADLLKFLNGTLLGPPSFALGTTIVGGGIDRVDYAGGPKVHRSGINAIPGWCEATLDIRFPPGRDYPMELGSTQQRVIDTIATFLERSRSNSEIGVTVNLINSGPPVAMSRSMAQAASLPLVVAERARALQILGYESDIETAPGGTNATFMTHEGRIPTLVELGPAGGLSHDVHEFVELDDIFAGAKILALLAIDQVGLAS